MITLLVLLAMAFAPEKFDVSIGIMLMLIVLDAMNIIFGFVLGTKS